MEKTIRILVAGEDPDFLKMLEASLKEAGSPYALRKVSAGRECLEALRQESFDILLLNHALPDGAGLQWLRRFNDLGIAVPTIFVTAQGDPRLALEAMREGVFDYINRSAECAKAFPFVLHRAVEGHTLMVEKVRLQKELITTKSFLESIVEKAGDAISVIDNEGKILFWNEGAGRVYGFKAEEAMGKTLSELLFGADEGRRGEEEDFLKGMIGRIQGEEIVPPAERTLRTRDGREIVTSMSLAPLKDEGGRMIGAIRICRDITQMKKAEERLILAERLSCLGELSAGVAHELRNPLAGIKLNAQILSRRREIPDMEKRLIESTLEGIEKIQRIVDDMLHFAKPKPAHFQEEAVNEVVEKSLLILQHKFKRGDVRLVFEKGARLPPVRIDVHQIQQVLINLMLNAIQAMEKGGTLSIRTFAENGGVGISVRDTGTGISKEHLKKIFDPFFTTKSEGTGLGLPISLKILEKHGATLSVSSEEEKGSTFTIHLPGGASA